MRRSRHAAAVALLVTATCSLPPLPSQPSGPPELQIRGTTLLMVGGRGRLTAWTPTNGEMREIQASWRAEGDAISLTSTGLVSGRRLGGALVRASAGKQSGSTTVHVVPSVEGTWRGSISVIGCWQTVATTPDPCEGRSGTNAPLLVRVTQRAAADEFDNLRATVEVFSPPATGSFIGALESSGYFFLDGHVQRPSDLLGGGVKLRWRLEGDRLVPLSATEFDDKVDVQLSLRAGSTWLSFNEIWQVSGLTR